MVRLSTGPVAGRRTLAEPTHFLENPHIVVPALTLTHHRRVVVYCGSAIARKATQGIMQRPNSRRKSKKRGRDPSLAAARPKPPCSGGSFESTAPPVSGERLEDLSPKFRQSSTEGPPLPCDSGRQAPAELPGGNSRLMAERDSVPQTRTAELRRSDESSRSAAKVIPSPRRSATPTQAPPPPRRSATPMPVSPRGATLASAARRSTTPPPPSSRSRSPAPGAALSRIPTVPSPPARSLGLPQVAAKREESQGARVAETTVARAVSNPKPPPGAVRRDGVHERAGAAALRGTSPPPERSVLPAGVVAPMLTAERRPAEGGHVGMSVPRSSGPLAPPRPSGSHLEGEKRPLPTPTRRPTPSPPHPVNAGDKAEVVDESCSRYTGDLATGPEREAADARGRTAPPPRPIRVGKRPSDPVAPSGGGSPAESRASGLYSMTAAPECVGPRPSHRPAGQRPSAIPGAPRVSTMPPSPDAPDLTSDERISRLKAMVGRLLKELRQREDELAQAIERKEQLRQQLQHANESLEAAGAVPPADRSRDSGEFSVQEIATLRRRVKVLESALAGEPKKKREEASDGELHALRVRNESLLQKNAELELRVAELKAKSTFRNRLLRDWDVHPKPSPASVAHDQTAKDAQKTIAASPSPAVPEPGDSTRGAGAPDASQRTEPGVAPEHGESPGCGSVADDSGPKRSVTD